MGRQLQLAATHTDEEELLRYIHSISPIRVFQSFAHSIDELWIDDWKTQEFPAIGVYIWPQTFSWSPEYSQTGGPRCPPERAGRYYVSNKSAAPILELDSSFFERRQFGRIYWFKDFSAPNGLDYDVEAFTELTDSVWRWIRKTGKRQPAAGAGSPYFLPNAWLRYGQIAA